MALISPGVQVSVIDESFYTPSAAGTVPMIFVASASNKQNGSKTGIAPGTLASNAGKPYLITSQRELVETFGDPLFYSDNNGNMIHAGELNEYGLQTTYSVLGVTNRAYVVRANIDLSKLAPSSSAPGGEPLDGSYWFNTLVTSFGVLEWNGAAGSVTGGQSFSAVTPIVVSKLSEVVGSSTAPGAPKKSVGTNGDYAVVAITTTNKLWYKNQGGNWVEVGSTEWKASWSAARGTISNPPIAINKTVIIDDVAVTTTGTTLANLVTDINTANIPGVSAKVVNNTLELYSSNSVLMLAEGNGTVLASVGLAAKAYYTPEIAIQPHTKVPAFKAADSAPKPTGSLWIKTTEPNGGAKFRVNIYNADTQLWEAVTAPLYTSPQEAIYNLDKSGGGTNLKVGDLYVKVNVAETVSPLATYTIYRRAVAGQTRIVSSRVDNQFYLPATGNPPVAAPPRNYTFTIQETLAASATLNAPVTISVTVTGAPTDAEAIAGAISSNAGLVNVTAEVDSLNRVIIRHKLGGDFRIVDTDSVLTRIGLNPSTAANLYAAPAAYNNTNFVASNWKTLTYEVNDTAPLSLTNDGELWYNSTVDEIDIMINDGEKWVGYLQYADYNSSTNALGPFVSATQPTKQETGDVLADGDLWIDTSDLENYPNLYRWNGALEKWILVDKADQTTENGILFADARWATNGKDAEAASIVALLTSSYVDHDAPDPALYPKGMLLWNLRRSGFNVKRFVRNYINVGQLNTRMNNQSMDEYYPHRWVTASGNNVDGSGTFGRMAQRKSVVQALQSTVNSNQDIRDEEARQFNLMTCPGYPELIGEMITLNYDRRLTAFVVADSPMRLTPDATSLNEWGANVRRAVEDNDSGLVSYDEYMAVYYGAGYTSDNAGNNIVVPASHMALRTIVLNDQIAFPWFAPAGTRRGGVTNATSSGYVNAEGEFVSVALNTGQRDTLYSNNINPITFISGAGLVVFGQKTRARNASALDRVNVARLVVYMRVQLERLARPYLFEPNDKITRDQIKASADAFCLELVSLRALYDFLVVCDESNNTPARIDRNELYVDIAIEPVKAIEFIYIPLRIKNTGEIANL